MKHIYILIISFWGLQPFLIAQFLSVSDNSQNFYNPGACQTINVSITTNKATNNPKFLTTFPAELIDFKGNATFSDADTGASYKWTFGDGAEATGLDVQHVYINTGVYEVKFTATDANACSATDSITVIVLKNGIITVNNKGYLESSYDPETLISEVLITGGCSNITDVFAIVDGSPSNLLNKSYGYFTKGGALGFPFDEGIILSTGRAAEAGNNRINDDISGRQSRPGDADLETALNIQKTQDASFIKFNFTPVTDKISFRYLMASEEYGSNYECQFSDGFAFLLREVGTTTYKNLAVLGDGTPVSVTNINNNATCSNNPEFFGGYRVGHTNFNGRTKVLTASAEVIPNKEYEIKLVIADQGDNQYDSAIFLEAGSFNLGADLGNDLTVSSNSAGCFDQAVILDTKAPLGAHTWFKDGVEIVGATGSVLKVNDPGTYSVDVVFFGGCPVSDTILVEFFAVIQSSPALNLYGCDSGNGVLSFDLTKNDAHVLVGLNATEYEVTYFKSLLDAEAASSTISDVTEYAGLDNQMMYARIENRKTGCFSLERFVLLKSDVPVINSSKDIVLCDVNNAGDGIEAFDLTENDSEIIGTQVGVAVSYHINAIDVETGDNPIVNATSYINTSFRETIYARLTNTLSGCFSTTDFDLILNPLPELTSVTDYIVCEDPTDGFALFDLSSKNEQILNGQDPNLYTVSFYASKADVDGLKPSLPSLFINTVQYRQDVFFVITNKDSKCSTEAVALLLRVEETPIAYALITPYAVCDLLGDNDGFGAFDLSKMDATILRTQDPKSYNVRYFLNRTDAENGINALATVFENTVKNKQLLVARVDNTSSIPAGGSAAVCYALTEVALEVDLLPIINLLELYVLCVGKAKEVISAPLLDTELSVDAYSFEWFFENALIVGEIGSSLSALSAGTYSVKVTNRKTLCYETKMVEVLEFGPPNLTAEVSSALFTGTNTITAMASGNSTYEYSLDAGPWQAEGVFLNVSAGGHEIIAREVNGCGLARKTLEVVDFPSYFTPNGDGYNDTWNIVGLGGQQSAKIYIFDRFGKLLKQMGTSGSGWNGTFDGNPLPNDDYWFTLNYRDPKSGEMRVFKSHFTLKR